MRCFTARYSSLGKRPVNEDSAAVVETDGGVLAVVADGLGGHENGEFASRQAVESIVGHLTGKALSEDDLEDAVLRAEEDILVLHETRPEAMTTAAVLWLQGKHGLAAHVGDSRIYQFRDGQIVSQSRDHSVAQLAVMAGDITPAGIRGYPGRNRLTRVLGGGGNVRVDIAALTVREGDRFLLCSDGFWESVTEEDMLLTARRHPDAEGWLADMRLLAESSARDNNTAAVVVVGG